MSEEHIIGIELINVDENLFEAFNIEILTNRLSVNDWRELTIRGTKSNILNYLEEYHGEGMTYFRRNEIK